MFRLRIIGLFLLMLSSGVMAQEDWFIKAFPQSDVANAANLSAASGSPVKISYDANVICVGGTAKLSADCSSCGSSANLAFGWFKLGDTDTLGKSKTFTYTSSEEEEACLFVNVTENGVLVGADTLWIYTTSVPDYTMVHDTICPGLEATVGADGGEYWAWSTSGTASFINIRPAQTTVYKVRISNYPILQLGYINTCYAEDSAIVTVKDTASFKISGNGEVCDGLDATVRVEEGTDVLWNGVPGETSKQFAVTEDMLLNVTATDRFGCRGTKQWSIRVVENPDGRIVAYVNDEPTDTVCIGSAVRLEIESELGDFQCRWFTRDTVEYIELYPQSDFTAYCDVAAGGSMQEGLCKARFEKNIMIKNCHNVYFASGYVLDGFNKTYGPIGEEDTTRTYEFRIFNHNGTMVFQTTKFTEGWDGRYKGKQVPPGVYVYTYRETYRQLSWERRGTFAVIK